VGNKLIYSHGGSTRLQTKIQKALESVPVIVLHIFDDASLNIMVFASVSEAMREKRLSILLSF